MRCHLMICPALTSLAFSEMASPDLNPHQKFENQTDYGYILLDITEDACQSEWYYVNTLKQRDSSCPFAKGLRTLSNQNHLVDASQTRPATGDALVPRNKATGIKKEVQVAQAV